MKKLNFLDYYSGYLMMFQHLRSKLTFLFVRGYFRMINKSCATHNAQNAETFFVVRTYISEVWKDEAFLGSKAKK